jgi:hypothetical protein
LKEDVTFFEKKVTKKTFAPAGCGRRVPTPAGAKVFCALFFKKALLSF